MSFFYFLYLLTIVFAFTHIFMLKCLYYKVVNVNILKMKLLVNTHLIFAIWMTDIRYCMCLLESTLLHLFFLNKPYLACVIRIIWFTGHLASKVSIIQYSSKPEDKQINLWINRLSIFQLFVFYFAQNTYDFVVFWFGDIQDIRLIRHVS